MSDDVVAELDRWLAVWPNHLAGSIDLAVVQRARDEIVALRQRCAASDVDVLIETGRAEALEEAAQIARENGFGETAAAIRALKERR